MIIKQTIRIASTRESVASALMTAFNKIYLDESGYCYQWWHIKKQSLNGILVSFHQKDYAIAASHLVTLLATLGIDAEKT